MKQYMLILISLTLMLGFTACDKTEKAPEPAAPAAAEAPAADAAKADAPAAEAAEAAKDAAPEAAKAEDTKEAAPAAEPADATDPDGLYKDILDKRIPYPMIDGKAAKYKEFNKANADEGTLDSYAFEFDTAKAEADVVNDYKKRLEEAGFVNDMPPMAPPMYQKKVDGNKDIRVHLTDDLCKEWVDDCSDDRPGPFKFLIQLDIYVNE